MSEYVKLKKEDWDKLMFELELRVKQYERNKEYLEIIIEQLKKGVVVE